MCFYLQAQLKTMALLFLMRNSEAEQNKMHLSTLQHSVASPRTNPTYAHDNAFLAPCTRTVALLYSHALDHHICHESFSIQLQRTSSGQPHEKIKKV